VWNNTLQARNSSAMFNILLLQLLLLLAFVCAFYFFADITPPQITPNSDRCYKKHGDCWCKIFLRLDALPVTEQTVKKNWRDKSSIELLTVAILGQKALLMPPIIHVHDNSGHSALMLTTVLFLTWLLLLKAFRSQASMDNTEFYLQCCFVHRWQTQRQLLGNSNVFIRKQWRKNSNNAW